VGWLAAIVFAGGVAQAFAEHRQPVVETIRRDVPVLPAGQAKVTGTFTAIRGTDVVGPPLRGPIVFEHGTATIENAGETIVWDGGRPFGMIGGGLDVGPTSLTVDEHGAHWSVDGPRTLLPGDYEVHTPVAVGRGGLASPRDSYRFTATDDALLDAPGGVLTGPAEDLHLTGPGTLALDGTFTVETRDGRRSATHLEFGPGPFEVDLSADRILRATLQGPLR
jgi:hypothetical protein